MVDHGHFDSAALAGWDLALIMLSRNLVHPGTCQWLGVHGGGSPRESLPDLLCPLVVPVP